MKLGPARLLESSGYEEKWGGCLLLQVFVVSGFNFLLCNKTFPNWYVDVFSVLEI